MKKIIIALIVLAAVGAGTYYIVFNKEADEAPLYTSEQSPASTITAPVATTAETPKTLNAVINIKNFFFNPPTLTIKTGTEVTWINNDEAPHTITTKPNKLLNSQTLSKGQTFSFIFNNIDSINYYCGIHPTMKGRIIIQG